MKWYTVLTLAVVLIIYTVIGGVIFSELEREHEEDLREKVMADLIEFIDEGPCINLTSAGNAYALLEDMKESGLVISPEGEIERKTLWDIRSSLFVSLQLIATIGFPSAAPRSYGGRGFTVPFAIFGIPLFLLTAIGMGQLLNRLAETVRLCFGRIFRHKSDCSPRLFRTFLIWILGIIFFIIIPSLIFKQIEPWSYGDAFYFSFITLFTIGFGDFVPSYNDVPWMSDNYRNWYRLAIAFWILLLSAWFAGVLVAIQTSITAPALTKISRKIEDDVLEDDITTNVNVGLSKDMKVGNEPRNSSYNYYNQQQHWQQQQQQQTSAAGSPYDAYNHNHPPQPQSAYSNPSSDNNDGHVTRVAV